MSPEAEKIFHLVYVSSAVQLFRKDDLEALVESARRNNQRSGVTGFLAYIGGNFIQGLEGPREAVLATLARIKKDPRHHQVILVREYENEDREFTDWALAYSCHGSGQPLPPQLTRLLQDEAVVKSALAKHCIKCVLLKNFLGNDR